MLDAYRGVLGLPGARAFASWGFIARLPLSMAGIGIVLLVSDRTGTFGLAGTITAAYIVASAVSAPVQGRLSDRRGQATVLRACAVVFTAGMVLTVAAVEGDWAVPLPHLCAALSGLGAPQAGSMVRARWSHIAETAGQRNTAFALEAVIDELVFIVGPVVITFVATAVSPVLGLAITTVAALVGSLALAAQHHTEPPRVRHETGERPPLGWARLAPIVAVSFGLGVTFGSTEVVVVAFATENDHRALAGPVLAVWAGGSLVAGLLVGALRVPFAALTQLRVGAAVLALLFLPLASLDALGVLTLALFAAGFMISPTLIAVMRLISAHVPASRLTEGITWSTTGLAAGVAPGAAVAGWMVDHHGASPAFSVPFAAAAFAAVAAWCFRPARRVTSGTSATLR